MQHGRQDSQGYIQENTHRVDVDGGGKGMYGILINAHVCVNLRFIPYNSSETDRASLGIPVRSISSGCLTGRVWDVAGGRPTQGRGKCCTMETTDNHY